MVLGLSQGLRINDMLGRLGLPGGMIGAQMDMLTGNPLGALQNLRDAYQEAALGRGTSGFERMMNQGQFPGMPTFSPSQALPIMGPICGGGYMQRQGIDLAAGTPNNFMSRIFNPQRRAAAQFEKLLKNNPAARQAFEQSIGGRIVDFGAKNDGRMTIERFVPGPFAQPLQSMFGGLPGGLPSVAQSALAPLLTMAGSTAGLGIAPSLLGMGAGGALAGGAFGLLAGGNPFMGMLAGGLQGITNGLLGGGGFPGGIAGGFPGGFPGGGFPGGGFPGGGFGFGMINGAGMGSMNPLAMPGHINNTNPAHEAAHQQQVSSVLNDPSLTVEDKVTLMLMLITKKMDQDIERQTQYINSIQQQQGNRQGGGGKGGGKGGKGGGGGQAGGNSAPSIDVETLKLQRMVTKRQQMFDMLKAIIDKYNETAKGVIQSLGR
ncbi:MAG: hypothetical protein HY791_33550 [Deltaproteobacteria bacterium]|nr:hypothetical protein [Deltaproteobacteria bacterium]